MAASAASPPAWCWLPVFDSSAPNLRVKGRRVSNWWANLETLWMGIGDSLFGFRVYPIAPLRKVMRPSSGCALRLRPGIVVRMLARVRPLNRPAPRAYFHPRKAACRIQLLALTTRC